ncbi:unnamed protein product [Closterium sp. NIES-53]
MGFPPRHSQTNGPHPDQLFFLPFPYGLIGGAKLPPAAEYLTESWKTDGLFLAAALLSSGARNDITARAPSPSAAAAAAALCKRCVEVRGSYREMVGDG